MLFFQYCNSIVGLFSITLNVVIALPTLFLNYFCVGLYIASWLLSCIVSHKVIAHRGYSKSKATTIAIEKVGRAISIKSAIKKKQRIDNEKEAKKIQIKYDIAINNLSSPI